MARKLFFLTGPTAVGKTELSLQWAEKHNAEIISCDSLLVYQGMDIGTAKPTLQERERVRHHLIDCVSVGTPFSVTQYVDLAKLAVEDILRRGKHVLVVGGSGFYLKSFFSAITDAVDITDAIKQQVQDRLEQEGLAACVKYLAFLNPHGLMGLDVMNPRRVTRALELCLGTGLTMQELKTRLEEQVPPFANFTKEVTLLTRGPDALKQRARRRVMQMLEEGLIDEVKNLRQKGLESNPSASRAIGYRETLAWLQTEEPLDTLLESICVNTNSLVRKQRTWFKKQIPIDRMLNLDDDPEPELFRGL